MKEELISFKTAKLAKEKGFSSATSRQYDSKGECHHALSIGIGADEYLKRTAAPTQSLLQKWLREEHCTDVLIVPALKENHYEPLIIDNNENQTVSDECFVCYEEALEKGLYEALKLI